jgi:hypothetical protein
MVDAASKPCLLLLSRMCRRRLLLTSAAGSCSTHPHVGWCDASAHHLHHLQQQTTGAAASAQQEHGAPAACSHNQPCMLQEFRVQSVAAIRTCMQSLQLPAICVSTPPGLAQLTVNSECCSAPHGRLQSGAPHQAGHPAAAAAGTHLWQQQFTRKVTVNSLDV